MQATAHFHSSVQHWFEDNFDGPTAVQAAAWPVIARGEHALVTAPTGSGKTLTAFSWSLSQFAAGHYPTGRTKVLYISPLKALNNDIQKNLLVPLNALHQDYQCPAVRVAIRSGDTTQSDRQRMLRNPPDILITTPESLSLLLTTAKGRAALSQVETLILDEIHSVVDNRRGVLLMANVERLAAIAGEFQRIALSATVAPLSQVADYVAGKDASGQLRPITIVNPASEKQIEFRVRFPPAAKHAAEEGKKIWDPLSDDFRDIIDGNTSTLFFTNSRRLAEKITLKINTDEIAPLAYAHHGSLARDIRTEVERRLKAGELKAIVATNSLEMGIDVGHLDEVVMVQSPPSIAATLQRIGRSGHGVGETSVGTLYPTHAQDFLAAAVLAEAVRARELEPLKPMRGPLDVLAQIIISICATDPWPVDEVFRLVTRASPYHQLVREHFDLVVDMLSGRYSGSRIRELKPRLTHDRIHGTIQATRGAVLAMYNSGGTIPDRGYFKMRHADTGGVLGELDEEFVWEATLGDTFTLGTQHWQIQRITHNDVIVRPARAGASAPPFWRSEFFNRSFHFADRIGQYLAVKDEQLARNAQAEIIDELTQRDGFAETAASELVDFLQAQREHTNAPLPHRHHLLLELVRAGPAGYQGPDDPRQLVLHTYWGGQLNQPYALALRAAWQRRYQQKLDIHADNNAIVLQCRGEIDPHQLLSLVSAAELLPLLRASLEQSGFFGARFRECAGRSLLLTKQRFNQRLPLWMSRMQAKKLMAQVKKLPDFPVMLETWRTCLDDEFDLPNLIAVLTELEQGVISWSYVTTSTPSPFAQDLTFNQISRYMYADDQPEDDELSVLGTDTIAEATHNQALRPTIEPEIVAEFTRKRQRLLPGYQPEDEDDWHEWLKERILIPAAELADVTVEARYARWVQDGQRRWLTHAELLTGLHQSGLLKGPAPADAPPVDEARDALKLSREILSFYGPMTTPQIEQLLPVAMTGLLAVDETFIHGPLLRDDSELYWCDADNFEILLRMQRAQRRLEFEPLDCTALPPFWAMLHRLHREASGSNAIYALESLRGYSAPVKSWLVDFLRARLVGVRLDTIEDTFQQQGMHWLGSQKEQITLAYPEDIELLKQTAEPRIRPWFNDPGASYRFAQVMEASGLNDAAALNDTWWQAVWQGELASDSLLPLQQAAERKFAITALAQQTTSRRRLSRSPRGWPGHWYLHPEAAPLDPLTELENHKERVRLLLDRYGFVCRELVNREAFNTPSGPWRWRDAFRALRIMELSGEVISGQYFKELATPQFIAPHALSQLMTQKSEQQNFWISALDPVAPCGLGLPWPDLVQRRAGNYLSFVDGALALTVSNGGRALQYHIDWNDSRMDEANSVLSHLVETTGRRVVIQTINAAPAQQSPYLDGLKRLFTLVGDHKDIFIEYAP